MPNNIRIEVEIDPIDPAFLSMLRVIRDDKRATPNERRLAIMCITLGLKLNELLGKMEFGLASISDAPTERTFDEYFNKD